MRGATINIRLGIRFDETMDLGSWTLSSMWSSFVSLFFATFSFGLLHTLDEFLHGPMTLYVETNVSMN